MANYRYRVSMTYMHKISKSKYKSYDIDGMNINNLVIHSDYINNNMPIILATIVIDSALANIMVNTTNIQNDYIILHINKYDAEDQFGLELPYVEGIFNYYTYDPINKNASIDYNESANHSNTSILRKVQIGLIKQESVKANAKCFNGILSKTTMQDMIHYVLNNAGLPSLVKQLDYNTVFDQIVIPSMQTVSKTLEYLNNIAVFYKTPYRFFIDFDTTYLIDSSGDAFGRKGETITNILLNIGDNIDRGSSSEGMIIDKKKNLYYIPILFGDCDVADNYITSQKYNKIAVISSGGSTSTTLDLNTGDNAVGNTKTIRISNDNEHLIENIAANIANSNTIASVSKVGVDNSIFTPNKEFTIQYNNTYDAKHNGKYLLDVKQETFIKESEYFTSMVTLTLSKIGS